MNTYRRLVMLGLLLPALGACGLGPESSAPQTVTLGVTKVTFPASVGAEAELPLTVTVTVGGCTSFKGLVAERSDHALRLTAQGQVPGGQAVCPAYIGYKDQAYTDPGAPPRRDPFEVVVNGKSYGTVAIR